MITARGGRVTGSVSSQTNFVVVGLLGSQEWKHSGFGNKILKAMDLAAAGAPIAIVSEKHWIEYTGKA
jgi:NAD-dependent DNA ligase